jgi:indolepyruvate ferredoxin oxidoreductase alpha subunit
MDLGCPAISVRRRDRRTLNGEAFEVTFTTIDSRACTGCTMCVSVCSHSAIVPMATAAGTEAEAGARS